MYCSACSQPLPDDAKFCAACGAQVSINQGAAASIPAPQAAPERLIPNDAVSHAKIIYFLSLAGVLTFGVTTLVGLVWAYVSRNEGTDLTRSHFNFQIATVWKGMTLGFVLLVVFAVMSGVSLAAGWISFGLAGFLATITTFVMSLCGLALGVWNIARWVKGLLILGKDAPIRNPAVWGLPA